MTLAQWLEGKGEGTKPPASVLLLGGLAASSIVELLVLRTFTRTAIHIPDLPALHEPFEVLTVGGRYAYFVSVALLAFALPVSAAILWRKGTGAGRAAAFALGVFVLVAGLAAAHTGSDATLEAATLASVALLAGALVTMRGFRQSAAFALFGFGFVVAGMHTWLQAAGGEAIIDSGGTSLLMLAEIAGVGFAFTVPLATGGTASRRTLAVAGAAGLAVFAAFLGNGGATARILLLWNGGLQGALPGIVYAIAAAALALGVLRLLQTREYATLAGLALLLAGGLGLHSTYQSGLVAAGFAALLLAATPEAPGRVEA